MAAMDHPPVVDLSNFEERKDEIVADLMKAATTVGMLAKISTDNLAVCIGANAGADQDSSTSRTTVFPRSSSTGLSPHFQSASPICSGIPAVNT